MDSRERFFAQRTVGHWNSLPGAGVTAPSRRELKNGLDIALGHRGILEAVPCRARSRTQ